MRCVVYVRVSGRSVTNIVVCVRVVYVWYVCVRACVRARARARELVCVRAGVRVFVRAGGRAVTNIPEAAAREDA